MAAFTGGSAVKLRAVCRPVEVRGAAAAMADAEEACGESTTCGVVGLVGRVGCARDVRDTLVRSGVLGVRGTCGTRWCGRARRVRAGRAGRRGTPGVCRWRRRSSAYVGGVVTEHGATSVSAPGWVCGGATVVDAPGRVRGLCHGRDDNNKRSCNNSDNDEVMA